MIESPEAWKSFFEAEEKQAYYLSLMKFVEEAYASSICFPPKSEIFAAFAACPPEQVKVVVLGQDPYHGVGEAHGLAFSVRQGMKVPPSLRNIFKELESEVGIDLARSTDLSSWAKQGVLLLNAVLTVEKDKAGSHAKRGWETFTDSVIQFLSETNAHVVFVFWGDYARKKKSIIDIQKHAVIESAHPSPLSAYRGFFGSRPFGKINEQLEAWGMDGVKW